MDLLQEVASHCPYCGEPITLLADASAGAQQYIEDCEVCCRPMTVNVVVTQTGDCLVRLSDPDR